MTRPAAIYARVSSDRQKENHTICSQLAALEEYAGSHGYLWFHPSGASRMKATAGPRCYGLAWRHCVTWRQPDTSRPPLSSRQIA